MKKAIKVILIFLIGFMVRPNLIFAKELGLEFINSFAGSDIETFNSLVETADGGYLAVGYTSSTDIEGVTNSGKQDALIVKYTSNGEVEWSRAFGSSGNDGLNSVIKTSSNEYIAVGYENSETNYGTTTAFIVKFKDNGEIIWSKNYGDSLENNFNSVVETSDGGYVAVGKVYSKKLSAASDGIIIKYTSSGEIEWENTYSDVLVEFNSVIKTSDGGYVTVGTRTYPGSAIGLIIKYNASGEFEWKKEYSSESTNDKFNSVIETSDKGYLVAGVQFTNANMVKYTSTGDIEWEKISDETNEYTTIIETSDKGYIAIKDYITKFSAAGEIEWEKDCQGTLLNSIIETSDNEYVAVGYKYYGLNNSMDAVIVKYSLKYDIKIKDSEHGTIFASEQSATEGSEVSVATTIENGYQLKYIEVIDDQNNNIELNQDDEIYTFKMPNSDVTIIAEFEEVKENDGTIEVNVPDTLKTVVISYIVGATLLIIGGIIIALKIKDKNK